MNSLAKRFISAVILLTLALASVGRASNLPTLIEALGDANNRRGASIALTRLGSDAVPALRNSLTTADPDVRVWSAFTLGEIGTNSAPAVDELNAAVSAGDMALRRAAAQALGKIGKPAAVTALVRALDDENTGVRLQAIVALGKIGPPSQAAVPALIAALSDHRVRTASRTALIRIGPATTLPLVKALATDAIRFDATIILKEVNPVEAKRLQVDKASKADSESLRQVLNDPTRSTSDRTAAANSLATLGKEGYVILIEAFENESIARTAVAPFKAATQQAVPFLRIALSHKKRSVRAHAIDALGSLRAAAGDATPQLIRLLKDEDRNLRYRAVRALHEFGPQAKSAVQGLTRVILNPREVEATRQWAIKTLVVTLPETHDEVVKALIEASQEKTNYGVRQLALQTLRNIDAKAAEEAGLK